MRARSVASALSLVASAMAASLAMPACSGATPTSGFDNPNNNQPGVDSGGAGGDGGPSGPGHEAGSFGPVPDSGGILSDGGGCATATASASRQPVYMLFVLDGSGSMKQDSKWTAATAALSSIFDKFQMTADPGFGAGLIVFSDSKDGTCGGGLFGGGCTGPYPEGAIDVPIAFVDAAHAGALKARISDPNGAKGDTPTGAATSGGWGELEGFSASGKLQPNGKKVLVILTDGVPTDGQNSLIIANAGGKLAEMGPKGPITTFVIGTGAYPSSDIMNFDPTFLGQLAKAGGAAPAGCDPNANAGTVATSKLCYFEVDPTTSNAAATTAAFVSAIDTIRGQVASCTFALEGTDAGAIDPSKVNVNFTGSNGTTVGLTQDPANGWTYNNPNSPTEVILNGTACTNMKNDPMAKITIILGCATRTPM